MQVAISQSNFLPWIGYFHLIDSVDTFVVYDVVQFTKRDWRNRNRIKSFNGEAWITVPVKTKGSYLAPIDEIEIDGDKWQEKLIKTIETNYSKSAFFKNLSPGLFAILRRGHVRLHELNLEVMSWFLDGLQIKTKIIASATGMYRSEDPTVRLMEICQALNAKTYVSGPAAKAYLVESHFTQKSIEVKYFNYPSYPEYRQNFTGFLPNLSALDIVFNLGWVEARRFIRAKDR